MPKTRPKSPLSRPDRPPAKRVPPPADAVPAGLPAADHANRWTFLTNHAHVLIVLARDPSIVLRKVALLVGITERAVQRIVVDLEEAGIVEREKLGRRNHYRILPDKFLRHPLEAHRRIGDLLNLVNTSPPGP